MGFFLACLVAGYTLKNIFRCNFMDISSIFFDSAGYFEGAQCKKCLSRSGREFASQIIFNRTANLESHQHVDFLTQPTQADL